MVSSPNATQARACAAFRAVSARAASEREARSFLKVRPAEKITLVGALDDEVAGA
jgi:shikimate kinase